jgi:hypothetical protein
MAPDDESAQTWKGCIPSHSMNKKWWNEIWLKGP